MMAETMGSSTTHFAYRYMSYGYQYIHHHDTRHQPVPNCTRVLVSECLQRVVENMMIELAMVVQTAWKKLKHMASFEHFTSPAEASYDNSLNFTWLHLNDMSKSRSRRPGQTTPSEI